VKRPTPLLVLLLLATLSFSLATVVQRRVSGLPDGGASDSILQLVLGDTRRAFAAQFFTKADVYFHSGYYPSVFDSTQAPTNSQHMTSEEGSAEEEEHERQMSFLGPPRDWIERFGRHSLITEHTHLEHGGEREILPWLKISAELDPHRIDTYTVAAYWLRTHLNKPAEAEKFLREGLRNNPKSHELLFDLGRLYRESYTNNVQARNVWDLALRRWQEQEPAKKQPDLQGLDSIVVSLAQVEQDLGDYTNALTHLQLAIALKASPHPEALQKQIEELKQKVAGKQPPSR
jgi:tetratricopeptide (TPR) repeat protein